MPGLPWIRLQTDLLDDYLIQSLPFEARCLWFEIYILAGKANDNGNTNIKPEGLDWVLRRHSDVSCNVTCDTQVMLQHLITIGEVSITKDGTIFFNDFIKRNPRSQYSAERTRKYRENKKKNETNIKRNVTVTPPVTSPKRHSDGIDKIRIEKNIDLSLTKELDSSNNLNLTKEKRSSQREVKPLTKKIAKEKYPSKVIESIFTHWKTIMNHPRAILDDKRRKLIIKALDLKYTREDLITAIEGCASDPWYMGKDPKNQTVYDDIELILRDAKHIDMFIKKKSINAVRPQGASHAHHGSSHQSNTQIFAETIKQRLKAKNECENVIDIQSRI